MKTKDIRIRANKLTEIMIRANIFTTKSQGYDLLTYTFEPLIGPYLTIELKDYDTIGNEL